jgi:tRNA threonylcarbamoyladenosine biosynthesis protein TsaE
MALLDRYTIEFTSHSQEQTRRLGVRLGELLPPGTVIALIGTLGAGKTHFARGIGEGWGTDQELRSPTFTLIQEHKHRGGTTRLYHVDLYRIENAQQLASLGLEEIFDDEDAIALVEWADRAEYLLPPHTIKITIQIISDTKRLITISAPNEQVWHYLVAFRKGVFGV